ncbi:MAG: hypothetical protein JWO92_2004 [Chitinophagaceae bacterium]|nr:hypothetical protein [Chitinophagaceae bacterium]
MNLGETIKKLRKERGFSQSEFAKNCELSGSYLSLIESNDKEPHLSTLKRISKELNYPLPILFFLSIDENDIAPEKKEAFEMLAPPLNSIIAQLFNTE